MRNHNRPSNNFRSVPSNWSLETPHAICQRTTKHSLLKSYWSSICGRDTIVLQIDYICGYHISITHSVFMTVRFTTRCAGSFNVPHQNCHTVRTYRTTCEHTRLLLFASSLIYLLFYCLLVNATICKHCSKNSCFLLHLHTDSFV